MLHAGGIRQLRPCRRPLARRLDPLVDPRQHLRVIGELDAPEVARRLMADHPDAGATPAAVVAKAAVDFCEAYGVDL